MTFEEISSEAFLRTDRLASQSLSEYKNDHLDILKKLNIICDNLDELSITVLISLSTYFTNYYAFINTLCRIDDKEFIRQKEINENLFEKHVEDFKEIWSKIAGLVIHKGQIKDMNILSNDLKNKVDSLGNQASLLEKNIRESQSLKNSLEAQLEEQKKRYETTNTNQELEKQSDVYKTIAEKYKSNAKAWLVGVILSGLLLIIVLFCMKSNFCFDLGCYSTTKLLDYNEVCQECGEHVLWLEMFKSIFFRLIIISINIYILTFCVKNYNACMHNKITNEVRQNSFTSALHFYNTTTGDKKDEILLRATEAIFSHRNTGYNGKGSEPVSPSIVQNIIDKVNPS
ncbi:hypothetical protein ACLI09_06410 [Flavobacterium sp. RHBU_24]|uniref:hypothetical protein n=1 Tax=Flavobacterium sp. RHBU_24 TaxID=3391185 RepID=UPI00398491FE